MKPEEDWNPMGYERLYMDEPSFEYVWKVADEFWPDYDIEIQQMMPSLVPDQFVRRYFDGDIDLTSKEAYLNAEEVQQTLDGFGLDCTKFWYLCLVIKDYAEGNVFDAIKENKTSKEVLKEFLDTLGKMEIDEETVAKTKWNLAPTQRKATLTLKVEGEKHPYVVEDSRALCVIYFAVNEMTNKINNPAFDNFNIDFKNRINLSDTHLLYLFDQYLSWFLKDLKPQKGKYASFDKRLLVSRMIYILRLSKNRKYYDEYDEKGNKINFLKNNLKNYKEPKNKTINIRYLV